MKNKPQCCVFCREDIKVIKVENKELLACISCGRVVSIEELEKDAIETFKAMGGSDFPEVLKEPPKILMPLFLDTCVTYLHANEKTWERVPMQLFTNKRTFKNKNGEVESYTTPVIRLGNNWFIIRTVARGENNQRFADVEDRHIDSKKADRAKLLEDHMYYNNNKWPSKPIFKKGHYLHTSEVKAWKEEAQRVKNSKKYTRKFKKIKQSKEELRKRREERAKEAKEEEFVVAIKPFIRRSRKKALNVYQALTNIKWRRIKDGKIYSCSWRHAGGLISKLRDKNETYLDYYCSGQESDVTEEFETYMKRKGWEKLPYT